MVQCLVVLQKNTVSHINPRYNLPFPAAEVEELKATSMQVMEPNLVRRHEFKNPLGSILGDARQVLTPIHEVHRRKILCRITKPIDKRVLEAVIAIHWQRHLSTLAAATLQA